MWNLKNKTNDEYNKVEIDSDTENKLVVISEERKADRGKLGRLRDINYYV